MKISVSAYQAIVAALLSKHYGIELNDTPFCETSEIDALIGQGVEPYEAINEYALDCDLARVDVSGAWGIHEFRALTAKEQAAATTKDV